MVMAVRTHITAITIGASPPIIFGGGEKKIRFAARVAVASRTMGTMGGTGDTDSALEWQGVNVGHPRQANQLSGCAAADIIEAGRGLPTASFEKG